MDREEAPFWESLYHKIKTKLASWHSHFMLTITGRAMLANFIIYYRPRDWIQTMVAPEWFHQAHTRERCQSLWHREKGIEFDANSTGTNRNKKGWTINTAIKTNDKRTSESRPSRLAEPHHVRALRANRIQNYLDADRGHVQTNPRSAACTHAPRKTSRRIYIPNRDSDRTA